MNGASLRVQEPFNPDFAIASGFTAQESHAESTGEALFHSAKFPARFELTSPRAETGRGRKF